MSFLTLSRLLHQPTTAPRESTRVASGGCPERVLFAAPAGGDTAALGRALVISAAAGAELHVLRVVPGAACTGVPLSQAHAFEIAAAFSEALAGVRRLRAFRGRALPGALPGERVHVCTGRFVDETAACARELGATLVVMPAVGLLTGSNVAALCGAAGVPVFVARAPSTRSTIVAATDLENEGYPVLHRAAALGRRLDAPVVAVHKVTSREFVAGAGASRPTGVLPGAADLTSRERRLAAALACAHVQAKTLIASAAGPADAILAEARERDADVIVVGSRPRPWRGILGAERVGVQIVDRARRSVLMTPLDADAGAARAV